MARMKRIEELEAKLQEGLQAIDILTEKLINLAVIENKFLKQTEELKLLDAKITGHVYSMRQLNEVMTANVNASKAYCKVRFKWLEKLFFECRRHY